MTARPWVIAAACLAALGLLLRAPGLLALAAMVTGTGLISRAWAGIALRRVEVTRSLSATRVFQGEPVDFELAVRNRKLLPLAWLRIEESVPTELVTQAQQAHASSRPGRAAFVHVTSMLPYETVRFRHTLAGRRGHYRIGPARLESGDLFGLYDVNGNREATTPLVVYPPLVAPAALGVPGGQPLPGEPGGRALVPDPLRPVGIRDYRPEDSRRQIHWKATARAGALRVKVLEAVAGHTMVFVLNAATFERTWIGVRRDVQDACVEAVAALAADALRRGHAVGIAANGVAPGTGRSIRVPPGSGRGHLRQILEALAAVSTFITAPPEKLLAREARLAPWGATLVLVTPFLTDALEVQLVRIHRAGRPVGVVSINEGPAPYLAGIPVLHIARSGPESQQ